MTTTQQQQQPQPQQQQNQSKQAKPRVPSNTSSGRSGGLMTHFAMTELKQRILTNLTKLADRDTQQIAMEDLEKIIQSLTPEGIIVCLNCLYDTDSQHKGVVRKECVKLFATLATTHTDLISTHLTKIVTHIVKRLKDPDSSVRDACHGTMGVLAGQYLDANGVGSSLVSVFVKPLFEAMGEQNKSVQSGSAMCLAKLIENAKDPPVHAFQRLCPKICKFLSNPNFLAKAHLLCVFGSLSQVGAISQQHLSILMQCITESLESTDWATRKGAADALSKMATHSTHILTSFKSSISTLLEACRFDKVKPVRDSMVEALQLWKSIPGPEDESNSAAPKPPSLGDTEITEATETLEKVDLEQSDFTANKVNSTHTISLDNPNHFSNSLSNAQGGNMSEKTAGFLKKKAPVLTDKELNPDFFHNLEKKGSDDWEVEVAVPRGRPPSAQSKHEQTEASAASQEGENLDLVGMQSTGDTYNRLDKTDDFSQDQWMDRRSLRNRDSKARIMESDDWSDLNLRDTSGTRTTFSRSENIGDAPITSSKGNWLVIQRQLSQMERQQAILMEMLQDFMGNSQHSMVSLENRVRSLERVVEDMARDLAFSAGRRAGSHMMGYEGPPTKNLNRYHGAPDYPGSKFAKGNDGRASFSEWFTQSDTIPLGARGARETQWRSSDAGSDMWDGYSHGAFRNGHLPEGQVNSRRGMIGISDGRFSRQEHQDGEQVVNRRAWERGSGPVREGPSARSVWQASKDEATLAAIRVAGEDAQTSRGSSRVAVPELDREVLQYSNAGQGRLWNAWNRAVECLHAGDIDLAYGEVLFMGDENFLTRLMSKSGPVLDQLSTGTAADALHAIGQFLPQQSFFDLGIQWIQQVADMVVESDPDCLGLPLDVKKELLLSLQESSGMELPEDWEGNTVDELLLQLASAWSIDLPQNGATN